MAAWHLHQYQHNRDFAATIDAHAYPDWTITALFHAGLQLVQDALLTELGLTPSTHAQRSTWLFRCARTRSIAPIYLDLKVLSERARYMSPHTELTDDDVAAAHEMLAAIATELRAGPQAQDRSET